MPKTIGARIEHPEVWENFKAGVRKKHGGKLHTVLGQEIEQALLQYIEGNFV